MKKKKENSELELNAAVGARLAEVVTGISQRELAEEIGVTDAMVSRYLSGQSAIPLKFIYSVSERFNISCHWLLTGVEPREIGDVDISAVPIESLETEVMHRRHALERKLRELLESSASDDGRITPEEAVDRIRDTLSKPVLRRVPKAGG